MTCPICGGFLAAWKLLDHVERKHALYLPANAAWDCFSCLRSWIEHAYSKRASIPDVSGRCYMR